MRISDREVTETFLYQAEKMRAGVANELTEFFPAEGDPNLIVTGFVFRPADSTVRSRNTMIASRSDAFPVSIGIT